MDKVDLTHAKLAKLRQKAEFCHQEIWKEDVYGVAYTVAACGFREDAEFIAAADPATVLAMVEEIEILKTALNLLMSEYYSTDLEHEDIDKLCIGQIEIAKKHRKSEAGHG